MPDGYTLLPGSFELKPIIPDNIGCDELVPAFDFPVPTIGPDDRRGADAGGDDDHPAARPGDAAFRVVFRAVPPLELGSKGRSRSRSPLPAGASSTAAEGVEVIVDDILENQRHIRSATPFVEYDNDVAATDRGSTTSTTSCS